MNIERVWAMPTIDTFDCKPIGALVKRYLAQSKTSIDPFARNKRWATHTNDLNSNTAAEHHMDALDFLGMLQDQKVRADLAIFDPPYSLRQAKECYENIGLEFSYDQTIRVGYWRQEKDIINNLLTPNAIALSFGWNTVGMGKNRGFRILEILITCHGRAHNDTLCTVEQKIAHQPKLL
jgi:hypothetical protein